jgi:hypothetical protein
MRFKVYTCLLAVLILSLTTSFIPIKEKGLEANGFKCCSKSESSKESNQKSCCHKKNCCTVHSQSVAPIAILQLVSLFNLLPTEPFTKKAYHYHITQQAMGYVNDFFHPPESLTI